jgi:hypothetical protein
MSPGQIQEENEHTDDIMGFGHYGKEKQVNGSNIGNMNTGAAS